MSIRKVRIPSREIEIEGHLGKPIFLMQDPFAAAWTRESLGAIAISLVMMRECWIRCLLGDCSEA